MLASGPNLYNTFVNRFEDIVRRAENDTLAGVIPLNGPYFLILCLMRHDNFSPFAPNQFILMGKN